MTIPDSDHILHQSNPRPRQTVRSGHLSRVTVLAVILIAVMAAVVGSLTWAYFSDTATATATFSTGTVGLQVCLDGSCEKAVDLPELGDIYPGWSYTTSGLELRNAGTISMTVIITATETTESGLAEVIGVQIYRAPLPDGTPIFSNTFHTLNTTAPVTYGLLAADADDDITFVFTWPETEEDQTELANNKSLTEKVTFYGTTEGVEQD